MKGQENVLFFNPYFIQKDEKDTNASLPEKCVYIMFIIYTVVLLNFTIFNFTMFTDTEDA